MAGASAGAAWIGLLNVGYGEAGPDNGRAGNSSARLALRLARQVGQSKELNSLWSNTKYLKDFVEREWGAGLGCKNTQRS